MNRYLFVINPVSGGLGKEDISTQIKSFCNDLSRDFQVFYTTGKDDRQKIDTELKKYNPDALIVSGGDGTINMVTPLLLKYQLVLGIIPAGSANGLAEEFGISLENAFEVLSQSNTRQLDIICLNDHKYMLHLADLGLNAMLVRRYTEEGRRGLMGYAISAIKEIGSLKEPFQVKINTGGEIKHLQTRFLVIANASKYGTGFVVNPKGDPGDQQVELCILKEISPQLIIEHLLIVGVEDQENNFFDTISVREATITCERAIDFQADGEYLGAYDQLKVRVLEQQVSVMAPKANSR